MCVLCARVTDESSREDLRVLSLALRRPPDELHVLVRHAIVVIEVVHATEEQRLETNIRREQRGLSGAVTEGICAHKKANTNGTTNEDRVHSASSLK